MSSLSLGTWGSERVEQIVAEEGSGSTLSIKASFVASMPVSVWGPASLLPEPSMNSSDRSSERLAWRQEKVKSMVSAVPY